MLLIECDDRIDRASDVCPISGDSGVDVTGLKGEPDGMGKSPRPVISGACGEGTNTVFLTSLRPRLAVGLRGVAVCCACYTLMSTVQWDCIGVSTYCS